ncbi:MAG: hypothetical protein SF070_19245 [Gemmatimonadota bacterium]|nr:hypothetical protein [Gemmatimonadota bacterium]
MTDLYDKIERLSEQARRDSAAGETGRPEEPEPPTLHQLTREPPPTPGRKRGTRLRLME